MEHAYFPEDSDTWKQIPGLDAVSLEYFSDLHTDQRLGKLIERRETLSLQQFDFNALTPHCLDTEMMPLNTEAEELRRASVVLGDEDEPEEVEAGVKVPASALNVSGSILKNSDGTTTNVRIAATEGSASIVTINGNSASDLYIFQTNSEKIRPLSAKQFAEMCLKLGGLQQKSIDDLLGLLGNDADEAYMAIAHKSLLELAARDGTISSSQVVKVPLRSESAINPTDASLSYTEEEMLGKSTVRISLGRAMSHIALDALEILRLDLTYEQSTESSNLSHSAEKRIVSGIAGLNLIAWQLSRAVPGGVRKPLDTSDPTVMATFADTIEEMLEAA